MSNMSKTGGNTKPPNSSIQSQKWCITWWMKSNEQLEHAFSVIKRLLIPICKSYAFAEEYGEGEGNLPHIQGAFILRTKKRWETIKKLLGDKTIHIEKMRAKKVLEALHYCFKEGNTILTNIDHPYKVTIELYDWQKRILRILDKDPDDRTIHWIWEPKGCTGKTVFQKYLYTTREDIISLSGKAADMKHAICLYKETNLRLPKIVLINIPRSNLDFVSYAGIEQIKDMYFFSGKYETGMVCGRCPHVVCFANDEPFKEKLSLDRWNIQRI